MLDSGRGKRRLEKSKGQMFLKGFFKRKEGSGTSTTTPSNNQLFREFKDEGSKKHALRSSPKS